MSDLAKFRDHCRAMAGENHKLECEWPDMEAAAQHNARQAAFERMFDEEKGSRPRATHCAGCLTDSDRALFALLAAEVDDYLAPQPDLFGGTAAEPAPAP